MLRFVIQKLLNRRWMALCLLIGNILLTATAASNPIYSDAVLQKTLTKTLAEKITADNTYPAILNARASLQPDSDEKRYQEYHDFFETIENLPNKLRIPVTARVEERSVGFANAILLGGRGTGKKQQISISSLKGFEEHSEIIAGNAPSSNADNGVIEAVISRWALANKELLLEESYELPSMLQPDGVTPYQIKIVGVYDVKEGHELYWDSTLSKFLVVSEELFDKLFCVDGIFPYGGVARLTYYLDYSKIVPEETGHIIDTLTGLDTGPNVFSFKENLSVNLARFLPKAAKLYGTLLVLQAPIFALLAAFIFMVSKQLMEMEDNEIAVLKSRGSKRHQILIIYLLQAAILALVGMIIGYPLAFLICQMIGSSNAFMEFVNRTALNVRITRDSIEYAALASVASVAIMLLPVTRYTGMTIVQHKVRKHSTDRKPLWKYLLFDLALLAVSLYFHSSYTAQLPQLAEKMDKGSPLEPMMYFSSSLFILAVGLLGIHLVPLLIRLVYTIGKKLWAPSVYTAFLRVLRNTKNQSFIMIFLVLTIALGIFNTASARSINSNAEAETVYNNGADVIIKEKWQDEANIIAGNPNAAGDENSYKTVYIEPDFEEYRSIEGLASITKVYNTSAQWAGSFNSFVNVMAVNPKEFGETATFDTTLLDIHWFNYLNALAKDPEGVVVSSSFKESGYQLGDTLMYKVFNTTFQGTIYGFVDYWPGYNPINRMGNKSNPSHLVIANYDRIRTSVGLKPYEIWMKMDGSTQPVYQFIKENAKICMTFRDTKGQLIALKNEPVLQGTNGVLTSNFIIVVLLCAAGFLIYWILSIRSRELQFGIYRAMGMSVKEVLTMLACEQILISGSSILIGVVAGSLATELYLSLIQVAYSGSKKVLPIRMASQASDSIRLFVIIGLMIAVCMAVLAWLISKIRIAQALKLGED